MIEIAHTVFLSTHCSCLNFDFPADGAFQQRRYYYHCSQGNFLLLIKRLLRNLNFMVLCHLNLCNRITRRAL